MYFDTVFRKYNIYFVGKPSCEPYLFVFYRKPYLFVFYRKPYLFVFYRKTYLFVFYCKPYLLRVSEANEVPFSSHIWVGLSTFNSL